MHACVFFVTKSTLCNPQLHNALKQSCVCVCVCVGWATLPTARMSKKISIVSSLSFSFVKVSALKSCDDDSMVLLLAANLNLFMSYRAREVAVFARVCMCVPVCD